MHSFLRGFAALCAASICSAQQTTFVENLGQWDEQAHFAARHGDMTVFVTDDGFGLALLAPVAEADETQTAAGLVEDSLVGPIGERDRHVPLQSFGLRIVFEGASPSVAVQGVEPLPGVHHAYRGQDPSAWVEGACGFAGVVHEQILPGVDVSTHTRHGYLEYDLVLEPGVPAAPISLRIEGAEDLSVDAVGRLVASTPLGDVRQFIPAAWTEDGAGGRQPVEARFVLQGEGRFGFEVSGRDPARRLVIDPGIIYASYIGGSGAGGVPATGVDVTESEPNDSAGTADAMALNDDYFGDLAAGADQDYVSFAVTAGQRISAFVKHLSVDVDTGLALYDTNGSSPITIGITENVAGEPLIDWTAPTSGTYFLAVLADSGTSGPYQLQLRQVLDIAGNDRVRGVQEHDGRLYLAGKTASPDFPDVAGTVSASTYDAFASVVDVETGDLLSTTLIGGSDDEEVWANDVDDRGYHYIAGETPSADFPTTPGAYDTTKNGSLDDGIVVRLDAAGALSWATYIGGLGGEVLEGLTVDPATGEVWVTGTTASTGFPVTLGAYDTGADTDQAVTVSHFNATGSTLLHSTRIEGSTFEGGQDVAFTGTSVLLTGWTSSTDFPTTVGAFDTTYSGGTADGFVLNMSPDLSTLNWSGLLGRPTVISDTAIVLPWGCAIGPSGGLFVGGETNMTDFFTTTGAFQESHAGEWDGFVVKVAEDGSALEWSTLLGGASSDGVYGVIVDSLGHAAVTGYTASSDFPVTVGAADTTLDAFQEALVAQLGTQGDRLCYSTYFGGGPAAGTIFTAGTSVAVDDSGRVYAGGSTISPELSLTPDAFDVTYGPGAEGFVVGVESPWLDLGEALSGATGDPHLTGDGALTDANPVTLTLTNALPGATAYFVLGASRVDLPFYGGTLVPAFDPPVGLFLVLPVGLDGTLTLPGTWDSTGIPSDFSIYFQMWIEDPAGSFGFSASNAISGTTP